jgi:hypothetical protein
MLQDNEFLKWLLGGLASAGGALFGYHKYIDGKIAKKADKEHVNGEFAEVRSELLLQRGNVGKLFDQIRENEQRAQDRHERVMERLLK